MAVDLEKPQKYQISEAFCLPKMFHKCFTVILSGIRKSYYLRGLNSYSQENDFITYDCRIGDNGDTVSLYKTINGKIDGLEIIQFSDDSDTAYYQRIIWDKGIIINVVIENAIFIGKNDKVVEKARFIDFANLKEYPEVYIESTVDLPSSINKNGYHFLVSVGGIYNASYNNKKGYKKILKQQLKLDRRSRK